MKKIILSLITIFLLIFSTSCDFSDFVNEFLHGEPECKHNYEEITSLEEPATCTSYGKKTYKCSICEQVIVRYSPYAEHAYGDWTTDTEAKCATDGSKHRECSICHYVDTEVIPQTGHTYGDWIIDSGNCESGLTRHKVCSKCSDVYNDLVEVKPHEYGESTLIYSDDTFDTYKKTCNVCCYDNYTKVLREPFNNSIFNVKAFEDVVVDVTSDEEFTNYLIMARFSNIESCKIRINKKISDVNTYLSAAFNQYPFTLKNILLNGSSQYDTIAGVDYTTFNLTLTYNNDVDTLKTSGDGNLTQLNSLNINLGSNLRISTFNDFAINYSSVCYEVSTNDQLFECLQYGVKPICKVGSKAEASYNAMLSILRNIIKNDMTKVQKLKAIHDYLIVNCYYDYDVLEVNDSDSGKYKSFYIDGVLIDGQAVCEGLAKSFCCLARIEGIPCVMETGLPTGATTGTGHAWNKVYVDGKWYIVDCTHDQAKSTISGVDYETVSYDNFLVEERTDYDGIKFDSLVCSDNYDIFSEMNYQGDDLNIESDLELVKLIKAFDKNGANLDTITFKTSYSCSVDHVTSLITLNLIYHSGKMYLQQCSKTNEYILTIIGE